MQTAIATRLGLCDIVPAENEFCEGRSGQKGCVSINGFDAGEHDAQAGDVVQSGAGCVAGDGQGFFPQLVADGKLADLSPTLLELMGLDVPKEMTGKSLIK